MPDPLTIRPATAADLATLHPVIERAYRGETARTGWTHEADLLSGGGARIERSELEAAIAAPAERLLVAVQDGAPIGCVQVSDRGGALAYLGLLCIDPRLQAGGLGRRLIAAAEACAVATFGATRIEMTVIDRRTELIAYYERRGYRVTGELRPFPVPLDPPLAMVVLEKSF
jgi:ribosomal protein S18 acetylase RimI-like enzyme